MKNNMQAYEVVDDSDTDSDCSGEEWQVKAAAKEKRLSESDSLLHHKGGHKEDTQDEKRSFCVSLVTLALSIPALIGMWCWPALVAGILGTGVSAGFRSAGHYISFGLTLFLMLVVIYFMHKGANNRKGGYWKKYGPLYMTILAALLIMADLTRHVLQDIKWWPEPGSAQFRPNCPYAQGNIYCLSTVGWIFTIFCTYTGFILLAVATFWNGKIIKKCGKLRKEWRRMRESSHA